MKLKQAIDRVKNALLACSDNVYHYTAGNAQPPYIVWAEDSESDHQYLDNQKSFQTIQGTIDLYTFHDAEILVDRIQEELDKANIFYVLNSVQYEDETRLIHYEWIFEVRYGHD